MATASGWSFRSNREPIPKNFFATKAQRRQVEYDYASRATVTAFSAKQVLAQTVERLPLNDGHLSS